MLEGSVRVVLSGDQTTSVLGWWCIRCLNPCAMSWETEALVLVTSQTSSSLVVVSCSHVVSACSGTTSGLVCWSICGGGGGGWGGDGQGGESSPNDSK
ncbi:hypothetical protein PIB30_069095 [Stylosanthes scabra]|uniref:Uncharacterized protein n=1 Tax=Stylosanthes scabra TaxID=79078 RepID=A0ABU6RNB8_9FABA|nr:hypothetical protein [Stylosanthes scabra]